MVLTRDKKYEQEIRSMFFDCLNQIDASLSVEERRGMLWCLIQNPHWVVFSQYENIYRDAVIWDSYDGKVILDYQPIYTVKFTRFEFSYTNTILNG